MALIYPLESLIYTMWGYFGAYMLGGLTLIPGVVLISYYIRPIVQPKPPVQLLRSPADVKPGATLQAARASSWVWFSPTFVNLTDKFDNFNKNSSRTARVSLAKNLDTEKLPTEPQTLAKTPKYWAVVRGSKLQVFTDESERKIVIELELTEHLAFLFPFDIQDYELYYKKYPICLASRDNIVDLDMRPKDPPTNAYYIYMDNPYTKEDMYLALIEGSRTKSPDLSLGPRDPSTMAVPIDLEQHDAHALLNRIYSVRESPQTQWLNALIGRLFLAVKDSAQLDSYLRSKIVYKLSRVKPSFMGDIEVRNIYPGSSLPFCDDVNLRSLSANGDLVIDGRISYQGKFMVELGTTCFFNVPGFGRKEFPLILKVRLVSLEGNSVVRVKPAPSSHIWYGFDTMPEMELEIDPLVNQRQLNYSIITNAISSMIRDAVKESLVWPFLDDLPFCDTTGDFYRGGIWDPRNRPTASWWAKESKEESDTSSVHSQTPSQKSRQSVSSKDSGVPDDDASSTKSSSTVRPIAKFWNNLISKRKSEDVSPDAPAPNTASPDKDTNYVDELNHATSPYRNSPSHTTVVTAATATGSQNKIFSPPRTFSQRKPVPSVVTTFDAVSEQEPREPDKSPKAEMKVRRKPVGASDGGARSLRASRSIQKLNEVVSRSESIRSIRSVAQGGHSRQNSQTSITSSTNSKKSTRRGVSLKMVDPEPESRRD